MQAVTVHINTNILREFGAAGRALRLMAGLRA
jgi:hypothetical protein